MVNGFVGGVAPALEPSIAVSASTTVSPRGDRDAQEIWAAIKRESV